MNTYEGKTGKQWLMDLARGRLAEMEKKGLLPNRPRIKRSISLHSKKIGTNPAQKHPGQYKGSIM